MVVVSRRFQFMKKIEQGTINYDEKLPLLSCNLKNIQLREHQIRAIDKMSQLEKLNYARNDNDIIHHECNYGILCDKVGSGKSIMILALLSVNPCFEFSVQNEVIDYSIVWNVGYRIVSKKCVNHIPTTVIIVPVSLCDQWMTYISNFTSFTCLLIRKMKDLTNYKSKAEENNVDIILLSNKLYQTFTTEFSHKNFARVVFDEVDSIDIPNTNKINAGFYWLVTASLTNIVCARRSNKGFLTDILKMNQSTYNDFLYIKNNDEHVDLSLQLSSPIENIIECKVNRILKIIGNIIPHRIQQMISAGDICGALDELNIFNDTSDNILQIVTESYQRQLQNENLKLEMHERTIFTRPEEKEKAVKESQKIISGLENKIKMIKNRIEEENIDPITYDTIIDPVITKCCQNKFDARSIFTYINYQNKSLISCPLCKFTPFSIQHIIKLIDSNQVKDINDSVSDNSWVSKNHNKLENLGYLYDNSMIKNTDKILLMTQYNNHLFDKEIGEMLTSKNVKWLSVQTPGARISKFVDKYKTNQINCLILNANYYGAGLNLEMTDHLIFLHKMPSVIELQVLGRAQRIGRKNTLHVWKLYDMYELENK